MTLQQLQYIITVDEYSHFGRAADACGITQPTLSLMIKKLEEELDVQIFDRETHPVCATEAGRKVIDMAKIVLYNASQLKEMTLTERQRSSGTINIAMISTVAPTLVPGMFKYIVKNHPQVELRVQEMLSSTIVDKLKKAEIDMGIMVSPIDDPELMEIPLYHERFLAYVSPSHYLYQKEEIQSSELLDHPVWIMKDGLRQFDKSMLAPGEEFVYDKMYEGGRAGTLIYMVNEIGGVTIVPELHASLILYSMHAHLRPLVNPTVERSISLVIRKDYIHEKLLNIMIDSIRSTVPAVNLSEMVKAGQLAL